ncbi:ABC transporter ATP-binding protein [Brevibacillus massiliensis]|jgi:branched-chain amino acid transport system ATP-binding protein|uniref:ABC transporter ATP-binding protein n=1 Tax=Brevibacillus massiliensis TaxID=1118054 RepID=UPI0002E49680|nr:ABC transporter ATP-binding protein [Brevibacillus massiliensis]
MLDIQNIDVYYGDVQVLHQVSLTVKKGEIVALLGSNGAGKTTALKAISGLLRPKNGTVNVHHQDIRHVRPSSIICMGVAHVPEGRHLFPQMTVEENLLMGAFAKKSWGQRKERLPYIYGMFPRLAERKKQEAGTLSGGEQQMVAIGRALMSRPEVLMLDEPSLGLAPKIVESIFELLQDLNRQGITILLVEQNAHLALEISHRGYVMETGKIVLQGSGEELKNNDYIKKAYLGI